MDLSIVIGQFSFTVIPFCCLAIHTTHLIYHRKGKYQHLQYHLSDKTSCIPRVVTHGRNPATANAVLFGVLRFRGFRSRHQAFTPRHG